MFQMSFHTLLDTNQRNFLINHVVLSIGLRLLAMKLIASSPGNRNYNLSSYFHVICYYNNFALLPKKRTSDYELYNIAQMCFIQHFQLCYV